MKSLSRATSFGNLNPDTSTSPPVGALRFPRGKNGGGNLFGGGGVNGGGGVVPSDFLYPGLSCINVPNLSSEDGGLPNKNSFILAHSPPNKSPSGFKALVKILPPASLDADGKNPLIIESYKNDPSESAKPPTNNAPIGAAIGAKGPLMTQEMHLLHHQYQQKLLALQLWVLDLPQVN